MRKCLENKSSIFYLGFYDVWRCMIVLLNINNLVIFRFIIMIDVFGIVKVLL